MNSRKNKALISKSIFQENFFTLPVRAKDSKAGINHIQVSWTITEWFESCTILQQKVVLCGITHRCTDSQLEYLLTALEPVFHRDFTNALTGKYPICTSIPKSLSIHNDTRLTGSIDAFNQNRTIKSFVSDYVKNIVANALNSIAKRPDKILGSKKGQLEVFTGVRNFPLQCSNVFTDDEGKTLGRQDTCSLLPIVKDELEPGVLRTGPVNRLPVIDHPKIDNQGKHTLYSQQKTDSSEKVWTSHFENQIKKLYQCIRSCEDYQKIDIIVELLKLCDKSLLQFYTQYLLQRLEDHYDINCLPDKLLLYIFSFLSANDINAAAKVCRRWHLIASQDELWILKCKEIGQTKAIPNLKHLVEESMDSYLVDWREAYNELNTIVENLQMTYFQQSECKGLRLIDVLTPARTNTPDELDSDSSSSASSSISSDISDDRQRSIVVDLPIQQLETFKKESSVEMPDNEPAGIDNDFHWASPTPPKLQSKSKLEIKDEDKKAIKKKKKKPKKPKEDNENLALDIRPDHEQAKGIFIAGQAVSEEEKIEGDKLTRHLNKVSMMVRAVKRVRRLQGHLNAVCCLKFDRRRIITGSSDHSIRVWDIRSGRSIHKIYGHKGGVRCIEFNDHWIVSGSWDTTVMVWDVVKFSRIAILIGHTDVVSALQLIDMKYLVTASYDKTVCLWCLQEFKFIQTLTTHIKSVTCVVVDGENVISGSTDGLIKITQISDGTVLNIFDNQTYPIATLAVHCDLILGGTTEGKVYFWDKKTGQVQAAVQLHKTIIHKVAFLPFTNGDDARFLTTSGDTSIKEWDLYTMTCIRALQGHKGAVRDVQVSEDRIVSCSDDGNVRIWDLMTPQFKPGDKADEDTIETRTIRQDKKHIAN